MVWEFWDAFSNQGRGIVSPWYGWNNCHTGQVPIIISVCWELSWGGWMCYIQCTLHLNNWAWREYCSYVECRLALLLEHMSWDHIWDCIRECRAPENLDKSNRFLNTQWKKIWNQRHEGANRFQERSPELFCTTPLQPQLWTHNVHTVHDRMEEDWNTLSQVQALHVLGGTIFLLCI